MKHNTHHKNLMLKKDCLHCIFFYHRNVHDNFLLEWLKLIDRYKNLKSCCCSEFCFESFMEENNLHCPILLVYYPHLDLHIINYNAQIVEFIFTIFHDDYKGTKLFNTEEEILNIFKNMALDNNA